MQIMIFPANQKNNTTQKLSGFDGKQTSGGGGGGNKKTSDRL